MKIGFTERGDGGLNLSWVAKCDARQVDGAVCVTKNLNPAVSREILRLHKDGFPIVVHVTITGWGGTKIEPGVPAYHDNLLAAKALLDAGFPAKNLVLRIDPIFPTPKGLKRVEALLGEAFNLGILPQCRCRVSVLDEYKHVKARFRAIGHEPIYGDNFYASPEQFAAVAETLSRFPIRFRTCAEPQLANQWPDKFMACGCLSQEDLDAMGLELPPNTGVNGQNRGGCLCLTCKTELLDQRKPCAHRCAYCYWKD